MTEHIQFTDLDLLIESRFCPGRMREFAEHFQGISGTEMVPEPEYVASELIRMADQIEADNQKLRYHLKTSIGKAVGSVVLHLNKEDTRCCGHCLVPMREHLSVDALCGANVELSNEIAALDKENGQLQIQLYDANVRLRYAEELSKSLLNDAGIIEDPNAQVELSQARMPKP